MTQVYKIQNYERIYYGTKIVKTDGRRLKDQILISCVPLLIIVPRLRLSPVSQPTIELPILKSQRRLLKNQ